jgi:hypothetical protein
VPGDEVTINPVQTVRWSIGATSAALAPDVAVGETGNKFDLYREVLDATLASVPAPGGPQVIAEYAIDLKFGVSVDSPAALPPPTNQLTFDMDTDGVAIGNWTQLASDAPLSIVPGYISRYCTESATPCKKLARARTIMSEVQLINQAGMTY